MLILTLKNLKSYVIKKTEGTSPYGLPGDGKELPKGATEKSLQDKLGPLKKKFARY